MIGSLLMMTFKRMHELKIIPIVDLCHFGVPDWIGNFQNPEFPAILCPICIGFCRALSVFAVLYTDK
ncbi:MAG: hypothetical protein WKG06_42840 [Segetibacter sp.]